MVWQIYYHYNSGNVKLAYIFSMHNNLFGCSYQAAYKVNVKVTIVT